MSEREIQGTDDENIRARKPYFLENLIKGVKSLLSSNVDEAFAFYESDSVVVRKGKLSYSESEALLIDIEKPINNPELS